MAAAPLRAPDRPQARPGRRCARADRTPRGLRARGDRASGLEQWRYHGKLQYSFGRRDDGKLVLLPRPRALGPDPRRRRLQARLRGQQRGGEHEVRDWARYAAITTTSRPRRRAAEPRRPRRTADRTTADPARHLRGRDPRPPVDLHTIVEGPSGRDRRRDRRPRPRVPRGRPAAWTCGSRPPRSSRPTPRWPSACSRSRPITPGSRAARAPLRPLLRDRDDRARDGAPRR